MTTSAQGVPHRPEGHRGPINSHRHGTHREQIQSLHCPPPPLLCFSPLKPHSSRLLTLLAFCGINAHSIAPYALNTILYP